MLQLSTSCLAAPHASSLLQKLAAEKHQSVLSKQWTVTSAERANQPSTGGSDYEYMKSALVHDFLGHGKSIKKANFTCSLSLT